MNVTNWDFNKDEIKTSAVGNEKTAENERVADNKRSVSSKKSVDDKRTIQSKKTGKNENGLWAEELKVVHLLDLEQSIAAAIFKEITYPWEALSKIEEFILTLGPNLSKEEYDEVSDHVWIAKTAIVAPSALIHGPAIIGKHAEIRHCAFIRGNAIVGEHAVVGNSTELKNVILFNNVQVPHYNYVGDSILGYKAHMGAGSITSNVKSDKSLVSIHFGKETIETGRKKFGAVLGDYVEIGCGSVLNPGSIVGVGSSIYPLSSVREYVKAGSVYKKQGEIVKKQ